jgi:WD40 repeat protein
MLYYPTTTGDVRLLDSSSWMEYRRLHGAPGTLSDVTMSQDQGLLAAAGESGTVVVWDLASGTVAQRIDEAGAVAKLSISPDGQTLLAGDERGEMTLWRLANFDDTLGWLQANRALIPLTCADLLQARVIASANLCPIITPAAD